MTSILIVDDEPDILFILRVTLTAAGYDVLEAANGATAIEIAKQRRPDLLITDRMMPVIDGRELIRRLRSDPETAGIPVIMVSANPDGDAGAEATIKKPFRHEALLDMVRVLIEGS